MRPFTKIYQSSKFDRIIHWFYNRQKKPVALFHGEGSLRASGENTRENKFVTLRPHFPLSRDRPWQILLKVFLCFHFKISFSFSIRDYFCKEQEIVQTSHFDVSLIRLHLTYVEFNNMPNLHLVLLFQWYRKRCLQIKFYFVTVSLRIWPLNHRFINNEC